MTDLAPGSSPLSGATRSHLQRVRRTLLGLHKTILEVERAGYERVHGRVAPGELLQLLMHDPWFGWFRPVSEIVVRIDEMLEAGNAATETDAQALMRELRSLLQPSEEGEEFAVRYHELLQQDPATILAHAEVARLLQPRSKF